MRKKLFVWAFAIACAINITFAQAWLVAWIIVKCMGVR